MPNIYLDIFAVGVLVPYLSWLSDCILGSARLVICWK